MKKGKRQGSFIKKPIYPGGIKAMRAFIASNLVYPQEAKEKKIHGSVLCKYQIDFKGEVIDAKVLSGLGHGCDEEAVRIVKLFKFKVPKTPRKLKVKFIKSIRINFKLPKKKNKKTAEPSSVNVNYTITGQKKASYSYTITMK